MADKVKGLSIEIGADTKKFSAAMKQLSQPIKQAQSEIKKLDKALKIDPKNSALIAQKMEQLDKATVGAKNKVEELKNAMKKLESEGKIDTDAYKRLQRELVLAESEYRKLTAQALAFKLEQSKLGRASAWAANIAPKLDAIGSRFMKLTKAAAGFALALGGIAIGKAFQKLESLEETRSIFIGLGKSADEVTEIMDSVTNSVAGTKYGLADMAKVAKGALGGGADKKYGLDQYLSRVGDLAAFTGGSVDQFGTIMNKALSKGTVDARLLNQMLAGGIPIYTDLAESMGVSADELTRMVRSGQVGFDDLYKATEKYKGLATETAMSTVGGALTILGQRWTNVGVAFLEGAYEPLRGGLIKLANYLADNMDKVKAWGKAFGEAIKYLVKYAKTGEGDIAGLSDKAQKFVAVLKPAVAVISKTVKWFMDLSAAGKKAVAAFLLLTGPTLKLTSGLLRVGTGAFDAYKGFRLARTGAEGFAIATQSGASAASKMGASLGKFSVGLNPLAIGITAAAAATGLLVAHAVAYEREMTKATRAQQNASKAAREHVQASTAEADVAQHYLSKLDELSKKENKTANDKQKIKQYVDLLNGSVEGLGLTYDATSDSLNKNTQEIQKNIDAMRNAAREKAYMEEYEAAVKREVEAEKNFNTQKEKTRKSWDKYNKAVEASNNGHKVSAAELSKLANEYNKNKAKLDDYSNALKTAKTDTEYFGNAVAATTTLSSESATKLQTNLRNTFNSIPSTLKSVLSGISTTGAQVPTTLGNAMSANKGKATSGANAVKSAVNSSLNGIGSSTGSIGTNAILGLAAGMKAKQALSAVASAASVVTSTIVSNLASKLKINSPSKLIRDEIGISVGEGMAAGMVKSIADIKTAAATMTAATVDSLRAIPVDTSGSLANEVANAVGTGMLLNNQNPDIPEKINVVVELGGAKVGETVVDLLKYSGNALYAEGV